NTPNSSLKITQNNPLFSNMIFFHNNLEQSYLKSMDVVEDNQEIVEYTRFLTDQNVTLYINANLNMYTHNDLKLELRWSY
ncbi:hypothetical protein JTF04_13100, partial [Mammaliicoccus vitulinus]|uniref:hypothetical protein n=1 Tax=Mammaliicoccus vitulinus TaxID=71237 RepID=UPI00194E1593